MCRLIFESICLFKLGSSHNDLLGEGGLLEFAVCIQSAGDMAGHSDRLDRTFVPV